MYPFPNLEQNYTPKLIPNKGGEPYAICLPPPNITGSLHLGHALNCAIQDFLIQKENQRGKDTLWLPGTDHATGGTQIRLTKMLAEKALTPLGLGRSGFLEYGEKYRKETGSQIIKQYKLLGASLDYDKERYTMDQAYTKATEKAFLKLFEDGLIYQDTRLINYSTGLKSAISDLETTREEEKSKIFTLAYPLSDGTTLLLATTSLHTIAADAALCISPLHPDRKRLLLLNAINPLTGKKLPIIEDKRCSLEDKLGLGAMKLTPGHDQLDYEIAKDHKLEILQAFDEKGMHYPYEGMSIQEGRKAAYERCQGFIKEEKTYLQSIPRCERTGERIELISSKQWFLDIARLAEPIIQKAKAGEIEFYPPSRKAMFLSHLENLKPWCISRQLWWGHRLPLWENKAGDMIASNLPPDESYTQSEDILDTWFSSALWPFASLGWPEDELYKKYYPTSAIISGRDIMGLWIARMLMLGLYFTGELPFRKIYIHPTILTADGKIMSKSRGTGIDPADMIKSHGADALRWGLLRMSGSQDIRWQENELIYAKRTLNKLYNSSQLLGGASMNASLPATKSAKAFDDALQKAKADFELAYEQGKWHSCTRILDKLIREDWGRIYLEEAKENRDIEWPYAKHALYQIKLLIQPIAPHLAQGLGS